MKHKLLYDGHEFELTEQGLKDATADLRDYHDLEPIATYQTTRGDIHCHVGPGIPWALITEVELEDK